MSITRVTPAMTSAAERGTAQSPTSGANVDFVIPSGVSLVRFLFKSVGVDNSTDKILQLGDSGGIEATGYNGAGSRFSGAVLSTAAVTIGFGIGKDWSSTMIMNGVIELVLADPSSNTWMCRSTLGGQDNTQIVANGSKVLSAELSQARFTNTLGTGNWTAGTIYFAYEF